MNTQTSLLTVFSKLTSLVVLTGMALTPMLASQGVGLDTGSIFQIGVVDLAIPRVAPGSSHENVEWVYVFNQGDSESKAATLGITWSRGRVSKLFAFPIKSLPPGEGTWIKVVLGGCSQFDPGTHIKYKADYCQVVCESNETNNEVTKDN